ncbi:uncharacterized protein LOC122498239 [Leptopilina heterotoma]|uniref:uncharacterized protein LOC122498239 n=1 Tax=Leptopilina heterotoma TaxID=63436 RepID=UPI001CA85873|nr:uncharacterized protein LOC122498239 [Leptopilina heterotoma]
MKTVFLIFAIFISTSVSIDEEIKVLDFSRQTVNLQWYNKNCRTCVVIVHDKTFMKSTHEAEIKIRSGLVKSRVFGLLPGHLYIFEIVCFNKKGDFYRILSKEVTTEKATERPNKPEGPLLVSNITERAALLHWSKPKNCANAVEYIIKLHKLYPHEIYKERHFISAENSLEYFYTGLEPKTAYQFEIVAGNFQGISESLMSSLFLTKSLNSTLV